MNGLQTNIILNTMIIFKEAQAIRK